MLSLLGEENFVLYLQLDHLVELFLKSIPFVCFSDYTLYFDYSTSFFHNFTASL